MKGVFFLSFGKNIPWGYYFLFL